MEKIKILFYLFAEMLLHPVIFLRAMRRTLRHFSDIVRQENEIRLMFRHDSKKNKIASVKIENHDFKIPRIAVPAFVNQWKEIFLDKEYLFQTESKTPVIIDLGANVGTSILFFHKTFPHAVIEGYEADAEIFARLVENLRGSNIKAQLYNAAVWTGNGEIFFEADGADGGHLVANESKNSVPVRCIDILDIVGKYPVIDFLKIDIEGAEIEVINRMDKELCKVQKLFIEYHEKRGEIQKLAEMLSIITKNGLRYTIFNLSARPYNPFVESWHHRDYSQQLIIYAYRQ